MWNDERVLSFLSIYCSWMTACSCLLSLQSCIDLRKFTMTVKPTYKNQRCRLGICRRCCYLLAADKLNPESMVGSVLFITNGQPIPAWDLSKAAWSLRDYPRIVLYVTTLLKVTKRPVEGEADQGDLSYLIRRFDSTMKG
jgi:hypothetical protein